MYHWDSGVYPYFATAIVKGKWSVSEYGDLLEDILEDNKVDILNRGTA